MTVECFKRLCVMSNKAKGRLVNSYITFVQTLDRKEASDAVEDTNRLLKHTRDQLLAGHAAHVATYNNAVKQVDYREECLKAGDAHAKRSSSYLTQGGREGGLLVRYVSIADEGTPIPVSPAIVAKDIPGGGKLNDETFFRMGTSASDLGSSGDVPGEIKRSEAYRLLIVNTLSALPPLPRKNGVPLPPLLSPKKAWGNVALKTQIQVCTKAALETNAELREDLVAALMRRQGKRRREDETDIDCAADRGEALLRQKARSTSRIPIGTMYDLVRAYNEGVRSLGLPAAVEKRTLLAEEEDLRTILGLPVPAGRRAFAAPIEQTITRPAGCPVSPVPPPAQPAPLAAATTINNTYNYIYYGSSPPPSPPAGAFGAPGRKRRREDADIVPERAEKRARL